MPPKKGRAASEAPSTMSTKSIKSSRSIPTSRPARAKSIPLKSPGKPKARLSNALRLTPAKQAEEEENPQEEGDWVESLPTLTGLFGKHTSSLVASFARFIPFPTFRSPALPSPSALDGLLTSGTAGRLPGIGPKEGIKHLIALQTYATALKNQLNKSRLSPSSPSGESLPPIEFDPAVEVRLARLLKGCIVATGLCAHLLWSTPSPLSAEDRSDVHTALGQLLPASFRLYSLLSKQEPASTETKRAMTRMHDALLRALFDHSSPYGVLVAHQHALVLRLQHTTRQMAKSKGGSSGKPSTPVTSAFPSVDQREVSEAEAAEVLDLLELFTVSLTTINSLPLVTPLDEQPTVKAESHPTATATGRRKPKVDPEVHANHSRPRRIRLEAALGRCELLIGLATRDMDAIKARSVRRLAIAEGLVEEEASTQDLNCVEVRVEHALVECLTMGRAALDHNMVGVLTDHLRKGDWVHESDEEPSGIQSASSAGQGVEVEKAADEAGDSDSESEADSDASSASSDQDMLDLYPSCPLSTLFRLCERFEEMRLAVWLDLPPKHRGLMWVFMRGEEGRVGDVWDQLGQRLLLDMDRVELVRYGLGADKVDQRVEVASKANAKRIRRRS